MSRSMAGLVLAGVFLVGCGQPMSKPSASVPMPSSMKAADTAGFAMENFVIGEGIRYDNLTIFPVTSRVPKTEDRFITLDEGLRAGTVEIREVGAAASDHVPSPNSAQDPVQDAADSGEPVSALQPAEAQNQVDNVDQPASGFGNDVNTLIVINKSDKPLYLMPGEVIIGGSQDRTIGNELVIAAHSPPTRVPVFCVEHGRWGAKGIEETLAQIRNSGTADTALAQRTIVISDGVAATLETVAQDADKGKFIASVGQLGKSGRVAVQASKDQGAVWDTVAVANSRSGVQSQSGAFTENYADVETINKLKTYTDNLESPVAKLDRAVGVLVAINGKIESIDVFESTPLFQKVWPKLLKSYALDASNARDESTANNECARSAAESFFADALKAEVASSDTEHGVALTKRDGQHVLSFTSRVEADAAAAAPAMGGMGGGVHFSGYAK